MTVYLVIHAFSFQNLWSLGEVSPSLTHVHRKTLGGKFWCFSKVVWGRNQQQPTLLNISESQQQANFEVGHGNCGLFLTLYFETDHAVHQIIRPTYGRLTWNDVECRTERPWQFPSHNVRDIYKEFIYNFLQCIHAISQDTFHILLTELYIVNQESGKNNVHMEFGWLRLWNWEKV